MTQQEPVKGFGCAMFCVVSFLVFWIGSHIYQYQVDKDAPLDWLCWNYSRQEFTRETRELGANCYYDP